MNWFIFSLLSVFALAGAELTQQSLLNLKNAFNERTSASLSFFFQSLLTIPIIFMFGLQNKLLSVFQPEILPRLFLVTLIASIAMVSYLKSFKVKNSSISVIFVSLHHSFYHFGHSIIFRINEPFKVCWYRANPASDN